MNRRGRGRPNRQPRRGDFSNNQQSNNRPNQPPNHSTPRPRPRYEQGNVPSHSSLGPGTPVSIILKIDQPTGHTVQGIVAELLTRGDHPRGVKVRLRDGRVGRVQSLTSEAEGRRGEVLAGGPGAQLGRNGEAHGSGVGADAMRMRRGRMDRDIREDDEYLFDERRGRAPVDEGLFRALEDADRRHDERRYGGQVTIQDGKDSTAVCPVCNIFQGDERAVAHHVESHFAE